MHAMRTSRALPVLLTLALAPAAGAQQATCDVNESNPKEVTTAFFAVNQAQQMQAAGKTEDAAKQLRAAVTSLTKAPEKIKNPLGRDLVLGKALSLWANQPGTPDVAPRGSLGFASSPEATVDVAVAMDSLFTVVETAQPGCVASIAPWRGGKPWITLVNAAVSQLNGGKADSAEYSAKRSLVLYRGAPYAHMVLGSIENQRAKPEAAVAHYRAAIASAGTDSAYAEAKRGSYLTVGQIAEQAADAAEGEARLRWSREAIQSYDALVKEFAGTREATQAAQRLPQLRLAAGDTAAVKASYAALLADPSKFDEQQLLQGGIAAAQANQSADAATLFEATLKTNPYNRDALFNAAIMYNTDNQHAKMLPLVDRLLKIDPDNEDSRMLYAHAYNGLVKSAKTKPLASAYRDSVGKYYQAATSLGHNVKVSEWRNRDGAASVSGTIRNKGKAAKAYTITVEFLDVAGTVVGTENVTVPAVAVNAEARWTASTKAPKVAGYRYKVGA